MIDKKDYFYFGKIIKPHGYRGDLTVRFDVSNYQEYVESLLGDAFFIDEGDAGLLPYFIDNIEPKNKGHFKLKFEDVDDENTAKSLRGKEFFYSLEKEIIDEESEELNSWVGYSLFDQDNVNYGVVNDVIDYSGNILLQITTKQEDVLVPFNDALIVEIDETNKTIVMDIPEGLFEMNNIEPQD